MGKPDEGTAGPSQITDVWRRAGGSGRRVARICMSIGAGDPKPERASFVVPSWLASLEKRRAAANSSNGSHFVASEQRQDYSVFCLGRGKAWRLAADAEGVGGWMST